MSFQSLVDVCEWANLPQVGEMFSQSAGMGTSLVLPLLLELNFGTSEFGTSNKYRFI